VKKLLVRQLISTYSNVAVKTWMDSNTNDGIYPLLSHKLTRFTNLCIGVVVTLLIVNIDNLAATEFDGVFQSADLVSLSYSPSSASLTASSWPTLGEMIDKGTRLVTFIDNTADFSKVPYIIDGEWVN
jgi:hypothetical protein